MISAMRSQVDEAVHIVTTQSTDDYTNLSQQWTNVGLYPSGAFKLYKNAHSFQIILIKCTLSSLQMCLIILVMHNSLWKSLLMSEPVEKTKFNY